MNQHRKHRIVRLKAVVTLKFIVSQTQDIYHLLEFISNFESVKMNYIFK